MDLCSGEQYDSDLGLYYLRARYYNPQTGRFLSRDPEDGNPLDPATLHKYLYAGGDPINGIDPMGRELMFEYLMDVDLTGPSKVTIFMLKQIGCGIAGIFIQISADLMKLPEWPGYAYGWGSGIICSILTGGGWGNCETSLNRSGREEMALLNVEVFARRWPYFIFVLVSALLFLIFVLFFPKASSVEVLRLPFLVVLFCFIIYAGEWSEILRARLAAVGLPHSRWVIGLYGLLMYIACVLLYCLVSKGRFLFPGLFILLNMPLVIIKDKRGVQD